MEFSSRVPNIFRDPMIRGNLCRPSHDHDEQTQPIEYPNVRRLLDALLVSQPPFSMVDYVDKYQSFSDVVRFRRKQTDGNKLKVSDTLAQCHKTAVPGWANGWSEWTSRSTLDCRFVWEERVSPSVQCRK